MAGTDKQYAVLGLGSFGISIAKTLCENGFEVMGVDIDPEVVQESAEFVTHAVVADVSDEHALRSIGIGNFDTVIMAIGGNFEAGVLGTLIAKELGADYVMAKAKSDKEAQILKKIGADRVVRPEMEMGERVAYGLVSGNILDSLQLAGNYSIIEVQALKEWQNKRIKDLNIRSEYGLNVIVLNRGDEVMAIINPELVVLEGDVLVAIGDKTSINKFIKKSGESKWK